MLQMQIFTLYPVPVPKLTEYKEGGSTIATLLWQPPNDQHLQHSTL